MRSSSTNYLHRPLFTRISTHSLQTACCCTRRSPSGNEALGRPTNPDFLLRENELLDVARGRLTIVAFEQGRVDGERPAVVQRLAAAGDARAPDRPSRLGRAQSGRIDVFVDAAFSTLSCFPAVS